MGRHRLPRTHKLVLACGTIIVVVGRPLSRLGIAPVYRRAVRAAQRREFGIVVIAPLVFATAGGAAPRLSLPVLPVRNIAVAPVAAVTHTGGEKPDHFGPAVVATERPTVGIRIAVPSSAVPPPRPTGALAANDVGVSGIPAIALSAYRHAEQAMEISDPGCGLTWNLLAGIGRVESMHANNGATDAQGTAVQPIHGPILDGQLPGNEAVVESGSGAEVRYARAIGPMQFLPGTWARYATDGNGDGVADPQNLYDSTLAAARFLCAGGQDLEEPLQLVSAVLRYNNSMPYARNVLGWADAYAAGVVPLDLPTVSGSAPGLVEVHLENPHGLGPELPRNAQDLPSTGLLEQTPLIDLGPAGDAVEVPGQNFEPSQDIQRPD